MKNTAIENQRMIYKGYQDLADRWAVGPKLFNAIVRDDRHANVRILVFEEIAERRFSGWTMGQVNIDKVNPSLLLKYSKKAVLNPFNCSGHASMALLEELAATAAVVSRGN